MQKKSFFITLEGTDGVGKSTHAQLLATFLKKKGFDVVLTREPGGGTVAEKIRSLLLDPRIRLEPRTELFLYEAARVEHLHKIILPALKQKKVVLCDRFTDATVAYQGHARGLGREVSLLNTVATQGLKPSLTLLLNLPPHKAFKKAQHRSKKSGQGDRMENEGMPFQKKVQRGYLALQKQEPKRIKLVPVQPNIDATQIRIQKIVSQALEIK